MSGNHQWVLIGHVHLEDEQVALLASGSQLDIEGVELCDVVVSCAVCERAFTEQELRLECEGPPAAYTRSGVPIHARDN